MAPSIEELTKQAKWDVDLYVKRGNVEDDVFKEDLYRKLTRVTMDEYVQVVHDKLREELKEAVEILQSGDVMVNKHITLGIGYNWHRRSMEIVIFISEEETSEKPHIIVHLTDNLNTRIV